MNPLFDKRSISKINDLTEHEILLEQERLLTKQSFKVEQTDYTTWMFGGELHRFLDEPSVIKTTNGETVLEWYKNGKRHRDNGPSVIGKQEEWFQNDVLHRECGPAVIEANGTQNWFVNGKRHREDGPAIQYLDPSRYAWFLDGKRHRIGGPAAKAGENEFWGQNGVAHREDGPAVIHHGRTEWHLNGQLHRTNGPAVETGSRTLWYQNGQLHRMDGPALVIKDKQEEWFAYGQRHREDGPSVVSSTQELWFFQDKRHRIGGPAVKNQEKQEWFLSGHLHRMDGPARIFKNGDSEYALAGMMGDKQTHEFVAKQGLCFEEMLELKNESSFRSKNGSVSLQDVAAFLM